MREIPSQLYSKEILSLIRYEIIDHNVKCFEDIKDYHKSLLIGHALEAFDNDVEVIASRETNKNLSQYLLNHDHDDFIEFKHSYTKDYYNHFSYYFDLLIEEQREEIEIEKKKENGVRYYICNQVGETIWSNSI